MKSNNFTEHYRKTTGWFQQEQQETVRISPHLPIWHGRDARIGDSSSVANRVEGQDPRPIGDMMPGWGAARATPC